MKRLIIATALIALAASGAGAANTDVAAYTPIFTAPPEQHDRDVTVACRAAGDAATPPPESMRRLGNVLILEGGDHRSLAVLSDGRVYLRCVHEWFVARWEPERLVRP